jgi:hypothetical protein
MAGGKVTDVIALDARAWEDAETDDRQEARRPRVAELVGRMGPKGRPCPPQAAGDRLI